jgi:hypothetical protein
MQSFIHLRFFLGTLFLFFSCGLETAPAQLLLQDSFSYNVGTTLAPQGGWIASPSGDPILISPESLSMPGFAASSGNSVALTASSTSSGVVHSFAAQTSDVYMSFILNVSSPGSLTPSGAEIAGFTESGGQQVGNLWLRADNLGFDIGGTIDATTPINWNSPNTGNGWALGTYLIVEQIQFPTSDNTADVLNAWITPSGTIPSNWGGQAGPSAIQNSDPSAPISNVSGAYLTESSNSPNAAVDELRVGSSWAAVTPVATVPEPSISVLLVSGLFGLLGLLLKSKIWKNRKIAQNG